MSALAVMLIAMSVADGCRRMVSGNWLSVVLGPVVVAVMAALSRLWHLGDIVLLVIAVVATIAWEWLCIRSERSGEREGTPLLVFAGATASPIVLSGWGSHVGGVVGRWCTWSGLPLDHAWWAPCFCNWSPATSWCGWCSDRSVRSSRRVSHSRRTDSRAAGFSGRWSGCSSSAWAWVAN